MKDGIYKIEVHGRIEIFKVIDLEPYIISKEKKGWKWVPTIIEDSRLKKAKFITEIDLVRMVSDVLRK